MPKQATAALWNVECVTCDQASKNVLGDSIRECADRAYRGHSARLPLTIRQRTQFLRITPLLMYGQAPRRSGTAWVPNLFHVASAFKGQRFSARCNLCLSVVSRTSSPFSNLR
jgi:hypothetical protein